MKHFFKIGAFLMLLFLLTAEDCGNNNYVASKEDVLSERFQKIENEFASNELSGELINAFEKRAVQKLKEISDYINSYADSSLSKQFRVQACGMIKEAFLSENDLKGYYNNLELKEDTVSGILYSTNYGSFSSEISSVFVSKHLQMKSGSRYSGEIEFEQKIIVSDAENVKNTVSYSGRLNFVSVKTTKEFGDKTEEVWKLYFCDSNQEFVKN